MMNKDALGRQLRDLRISVTDRCNFRCIYCMPREVFDSNHQFLPKQKVLSLEEIARLAGVFHQLGVRKFRLTGGEPLLRRNIDYLIRELASLPDVDVALTTNGSLPPSRIEQLREAGLSRMTVSLDSLDDAVFKAINDVGQSVARVLEWITAAEQAGYKPLKINMVVKKGLNEDSILPMASYFRERGHILRFIEFMDVGTTNGWRLDEVVPAAKILEVINSEMPVEAIAPSYPGEVARRYRYQDGSGEIGIIASVTQPFCGGCVRARLSADGSLYTCLFSDAGYNIRDELRAGATDDELARSISAVWQKRDDRYSELRTSHTTLPSRKVEMSYIGG